MNKLITLLLLFILTGCSLERTFCEPQAKYTILDGVYYTSFDDGQTSMIIVFDNENNKYQWFEGNRFEQDDLFEFYTKVDRFDKEGIPVIILYCEDDLLIDIQKK